MPPTAYPPVVPCSATNGLPTNQHKHSNPTQRPCMLYKCTGDTSSDDHSVGLSERGTNNNSDIIPSGDMTQVIPPITRNHSRHVSLIAFSAAASSPQSPLRTSSSTVSLTAVVLESLHQVCSKVNCTPSSTVSCLQQWPWTASTEYVTAIPQHNCPVHTLHVQGSTEP